MTQGRVVSRNTDYRRIPKERVEEKNRTGRRRKRVMKELKRGVKR